MWCVFEAPDPPSYLAPFSRRYVPDDEVSKEEAAAAEKVVEDKKMAQFEATNSEWCESQKEDMDKRTKLREKKERSANQSRLKGNNYFKARKFDKAEKMYEG